MTAAWSCDDLESGIDHYKVTAYELYGGQWTRIYPKLYVPNVHQYTNAMVFAFPSHLKDVIRTNGIIDYTKFRCLAMRYARDY